MWRRKNLGLFFYCLFNFDAYDFLIVKHCRFKVKVIHCSELYYVSNLDVMPFKKISKHDNYLFRFTLFLGNWKLFCMPMFICTINKWTCMKNLWCKIWKYFFRVCSLWNFVFLHWSLILLFNAYTEMIESYSSFPEYTYLFQQFIPSLNSRTDLKKRTTYE